MSPVISLPAIQEPVSIVHTVGHSNHPIETFLNLLTGAGIDTLADVRTSPYARYAVQFNRENLQAAVTAHGLRYAFFGDTLAGRPPGDNLYDAQGHACYDRIADTDFSGRE